MNPVNFCFFCSILPKRFKCSHKLQKAKNETLESIKLSGSDTIKVAGRGFNLHFKSVHFNV
jgi:hypothetical protein